LHGNTYTRNFIPPRSEIQRFGSGLALLIRSDEYVSGALMS